MSIIAFNGILNHPCNFSSLMFNGYFHKPKNKKKELLYKSDAIFMQILSKLSNDDIVSGF